MKRSREMNEPHYHAYLRAAKGNKIFYPLARAFTSPQAARQFAKRRQPDPDRRMVRECWDRECAPKLD